MTDVRVFDGTGELDLSHLEGVMIGGQPLDLDMLLEPYVGETVRLRVILGREGGGAAVPAKPSSTDPPPLRAAILRR
jgi:hypothetical protein